MILQRGYSDLQHRGNGRGGAVLNLSDDNGPAHTYMFIYTFRTTPLQHFTFNMCDYY